MITLFRILPLECKRLNIIHDRREIISMKNKKKADYLKKYGIFFNMDVCGKVIVRL